MRAHLKYLDYVLRHKFYVFIEARKLGVGLWQCLKHDFSKFSGSEWNPYVQRFYGPKFEGNWIESKEQYKARIEQAFSMAWLHHIHLNPHHWEYWVHPRDGEAQPMPERYIREMIGDWRGVSRTLKQGDDTAQGWYYKQKSRGAIKLHPKTEARVESLLMYPSIRAYERAMRGPDPVPRYVV